MELKDTMLVNQLLIEYPSSLFRNTVDFSKSVNCSTIAYHTLQFLIVNYIYASMVEPQILVSKILKLAVTNPLCDHWLLIVISIPVDVTAFFTFIGLRKFRMQLEDVVVE